MVTKEFRRSLVLLMTLSLCSAAISIESANRIHEPAIARIARSGNVLGLASYPWKKVGVDALGDLERSLDLQCTLQGLADNFARRFPMSSVKFWESGGEGVFGSTPIQVVVEDDCIRLELKQFPNEFVAIADSIEEFNQTLPKSKLEWANIGDRKLKRLELAYTDMRMRLDTLLAKESEAERALGSLAAAIRLTVEIPVVRSDWLAKVHGFRQAMSTDDLGEYKPESIRKPLVKSNGDTKTIIRVSEFRPIITRVLRTHAGGIRSSNPYKLEYVTNWIGNHSVYRLRFTVSITELADSTIRVEVLQTFASGVKEYRHMPAYTPPDDPYQDKFVRVGNGPNFARRLLRAIEKEILK